MHTRVCFLLRALPRHPIPSWHVWFLTGFLALVSDLKSKHKHNNHETEHLYCDFVKYQSDTNTTTTHISHTLANSLLFSIHPRIQCNTNRNKTVPSPVTRTSCSIWSFALIHHHHHHNNNIAKTLDKAVLRKRKDWILLLRYQVISSPSCSFCASSYLLRVVDGYSSALGSEGLCTKVTFVH